MRSATPKVLHPVCGTPILEWVLRAARGAGAETLVVGAPPDATDVQTLAEAFGRVAIQHQAGGTGDAVRCGMAQLDGFDGDVLVVSGDTPLIRTGLLVELVAHHRATGATATLLSADVATPNAYGRVVRRPDGSFDRIVEARDASPAELDLTEMNAGFYAFSAGALRAALLRLVPDNAQGELYLPDALGPIREAGGRIEAHRTTDVTSSLGINTRVELAEADRLMRARILEAHMLAGVTIIDPATTFVESTVVLDADSTIHPFCVLRGSTHVERGAEVGPHAVLVDAHVGEDARVGPFCYLRPGARLARRAKAGTFVEIKNSTVGEGAKVPHLSYIGDADIGPGSNVGAGAITANYHRGRKTRTTIGAHVHIGSDNVFVAPVTIGDGAYTAAGSIITDDVPNDALAVARARQVNIDDYASRSDDG
jgi:bifunctional UDP-N-acetylglucosamine pyrophosphorylase/glucosamine-1-phosphate N-acetyltransferase